MLQKPCFFLLLFCFFNFSTSAQTIDWIQNYGGSKEENVSDMEITNDEGYVIAGYSFSSDGDVSGNYGDKDYWILKADSAGNIQWEQNYGGSDKDWAYSIQQTSDSGYIVAGFSQSTDGDVSGNNGGNDYWILKLNSTGNIEWEQNYGGNKSDIANAVKQTADGGYFVAGQSSTYNTGSFGVPDYWLLKLDSLGNIQWSQSYGGSGTDDPQSIQRTEEKSYVIAGGGASTDGDVKNNNGSKNTWVVKVDSMGKILWENSYEGGNATSIKKAKDGGFILTGRVRGNNNTFECLVLKIDSSGKLKWKKKYGGSDYDQGIEVYQKTNGKFVLAGLSMSSDGEFPDNKGNGDSWIIILDSLGNIKWSKNYGGTGLDVINSIQENSEGQLILAGHTNSTSGDVKSNKGSYDIWLLKTCFSVATISKERCYSYTVPSGDETYSSSGVYKDTILNSNNCNSFITINLKINNTKSTVTKNSCNSFTVPSGDEKYDTSGIYYDTIPNSSNCDSIITFNLTINDVDTSVNRVSANKLEANLKNGVYQWLDCSNGFVPIAGKTNKTFSVDSNGRYAVEVTKNGCTDTSNCLSIQNVGILENNIHSNLKIYPNPTESKIRVELREQFDNIKAIVREPSGKKLYSKNFKNTSNLDLDINGPKGIYLIQVQGSNSKSASFKVIKR